VDLFGIDFAAGSSQNGFQALDVFAACLDDLVLDFFEKRKKNLIFLMNLVELKSFENERSLYMIFLLEISTVIFWIFY
jgi:hypothetical protein